MEPFLPDSEVERIHDLISREFPTLRDAVLVTAVDEKRVAFNLMILTPHPKHPNMDLMTSAKGRVKDWERDAKTRLHFVGAQSDPALVILSDARIHGLVLMARIGRFTGMAAGPYGASLSTVQPIDSIFPKKAPDPGSTSGRIAQKADGTFLTPDEIEAGFYRMPEIRNGSDLASTNPDLNDSSGYYILPNEPRIAPILGNDTYRK